MAFWDFLKIFRRGQAPAPQPSHAPAIEPPPLPVRQPASPPAPSPRRERSATEPDLEPAVPPLNGPKPGDFLPIKRDDLLRQGEEVRRTTGWMWFGRRDIIPPTSDPRTLLIDRGMVTQGFLTAEQLAEMHQVGDEWHKHEHRLEHIQAKAGQNAEQAVEADRAARAERKAQKKAEAAARRKQRADEVAHRKATDIIFVGKGVSARMRDRASDPAKLAEAGLPILHTPADLAAALGLTISRLRWLCYHTEAATRIHYVQFEVPKRSGGTRTLSAPHRTLATAQEWVFVNILKKLPVEEPAHGFVPGRSTVTNAVLHSARDVVINMDLEGFFPSISFARVRHQFHRLGYSGAISTLLALLCTECPRKRVVYSGTPYYVATGPRGLPQGACTSPALSNQIARRLDRRLAGLARKLGLNYTRYADDLTFSAAPGFRDKVGYVIARIRHIAEEEGFAINLKKTRVQRLESRQVVTGLVVNAKPAVPRDVVRRIRAILHRAKTEGLAAQNREGNPNFRGWLEGMIAYIAMVRPDVGLKLRTSMDELNMPPQ